MLGCYLVSNLSGLYGHRYRCWHSCISSVIQSAAVGLRKVHTNVIFLFGLVTRNLRFWGFFSEIPGYVYNFPNAISTI